MLFKDKSTSVQILIILLIGISLVSLKSEVLAEVTFTVEIEDTEIPVEGLDVLMLIDCDGNDNDHFAEGVEVAPGVYRHVCDETCLDINTEDLETWSYSWDPEETVLPVNPSSNPSPWLGTNVDVDQEVDDNRP